MFRSRFFRRLYLTYAVLVLITAGLIGLLIERQVQEFRLEQIRQRLASTAAAIHPLALDTFTDPDFDPDPLVDEIGARSGIRVTLIEPSGHVRADSDRDPGSMDDHSTRPEVAQALREGEGLSSRFSNTVGMRMMYYASRIQRNGATIGVVRVAIPLSEAEAQSRTLRTQILRGALIASLLALGLGILVARRITVPITEMTAASEALRTGNYDVRVRTRGRDEIQTLGRNLNRLADELRERLSSLSHQRAQVNAIIRSMHEGVVAVDRERRILVSNHIARELLELEADQERLGAEQCASAPGLEELIEELGEGADAAHREITIDHDGQEPTVLDARGARFEVDDEVGVVIVLYNISDLRRLERVRTDFVANVSHELKTPLTSIQGYVETLLDGAVDDPDNNVRFLEKIRQHVGRLSSLVADLLSLARIESPDSDSRLTPIDWREIVAESVSRRRDPIAARQLSLSVEVGDQPTRVLGEPEGMRQVIDNLLDNAIAYTPEGGRITVRVEGRYGYGVVEIADSGIGIPEEAIPRIFERFYRIDRGRSRQLGGTGLGLSIVRNLVSRMEGVISVESEVGKGSKFTVGIPLADVS